MRSSCLWHTDRRAARSRSAYAGKVTSAGAVPARDGVDEPAEGLAGGGVLVLLPPPAAVFLCQAADTAQRQRRRGQRRRRPRDGRSGSGASREGSTIGRCIAQRSPFRSLFVAVCCAGFSCFTLQLLNPTTSITCIMNFLSTGNTSELLD